MTISTHATLKTAAAAFGNRDDLSDTVLSECVGNAEAMIARTVRANELVTSVTLDEDDRSAGAVYTLPPDFLGARALYGTYSSVEYQVEIVSLAELRSFAASTPPLFAATYGYTLEFRGTPATDSEYDLIYYARPAAFSADGDTNTLLVNHPDLYLTATEYWIHMKAENEDLASRQLAAFNQIVRTLNELANHQRGGSSTRASHNLGNFSRSAM